MDADDAPRTAGQRLVMGDDDEGGAGFRAAGQQQFDNRAAGGGVEIAGGLVGKQQRGARGQCAGDGHTLLLAAGELGGIMVQPVAKAHRGQFFGRAGFRIGKAGQFQRGHHIFQRCHGGQQVEGLKHHSDAPAPRQRQPVFRQAHEIRPAYAQRSAAGALKAGEHRHKAGFAAARGAQNGQNLSGWHGKIHAFEDRRGRIARAQSEREAGGDKGGLAIKGLGHNKGMGIAGGAGKQAIQFMTLRAGIWALLAAVAVLGGCGKAPEPEKAATTGVQAPLPVMPPAPQGPQVRIVALGDSLFAGYGLRPEEAYPLRLQAALRRKGINAEVVNAGVSGDTAADGLARLDFTLGDGPAPDLVILSLGGNDMLRGLPVAQARANLDALLGKLAARHAKVVVMGMLAAPNMGPDYARGFNAIFPDLAKKHGAALVPFLLKAVYKRPDLQLPDHIHPTAQGVEAMVADTVDAVTAALPHG